MQEFIANLNQNKSFKIQKLTGDPLGEFWEYRWFACKDESCSELDQTFYSINGVDNPVNNWSVDSSVIFRFNTVTSPGEYYYIFCEVRQKKALDDITDICELTMIGKVSVVSAGSSSYVVSNVEISDKCLVTGKTDNHSYSDFNVVTATIDSTSSVLPESVTFNTIGNKLYLTTDSNFKSSYQTLSVKPYLSDGKMKASVLVRWSQPGITQVNCYCTNSGIISNTFQKKNINIWPEALTTFLSSDIPATLTPELNSNIYNSDVGLNMVGIKKNSTVKIYRKYVTNVSNLEHLSQIIPNLIFDETNDLIRVVNNMNLVVSNDFINNFQITNNSLIGMQSSTIAIIYKMTLIDNDEGCSFNSILFDMSHFVTIQKCVDSIYLDQLSTSVEYCPTTIFSDFNTHNDRTDIVVGDPCYFTETVEFKPCVAENCSETETVEFKPCVVSCVETETVEFKPCSSYCWETETVEFKPCSSYCWETETVEFKPCVVSCIETETMEYKPCIKNCLETVTVDFKPCFKVNAFTFKEAMLNIYMTCQGADSDICILKKTGIIGNFTNYAI